MPARREPSCLGAERGSWGEDVAADFLRRRGYLIVDSNSRPVEKDRRLEIDLVAWEESTDTMVFVEVKQHGDLKDRLRRLRSVDRGKRANLRRACNAWRRVNKWRGDFRFDVIEIYGTPEGGRPVIDHVERVNLFAKPGRFVKWC